MKLSMKEFDAMQMGWRKWYIEKMELKTFEKFGLAIRGMDILEVGCGNGYAASLITAKQPHSYTGLDIMPEQLEIARGRNLPSACFVEGSADDLSRFPDGSFDAVLDFCILHHVEGWRIFLTNAAGCCEMAGASTSPICRRVASILWTPCCTGDTQKRPSLRSKNLKRRPTGGDLQQFTRPANWVWKGTSDLGRRK